MNMNDVAATAGPSAFGPNGAAVVAMLDRIRQITPDERRALAAAEADQPQFLGGPSFLEIALANGLEVSQDAVRSAVMWAVFANNNVYAASIGVGEGTHPGDWLELDWNVIRDVINPSDTCIYRAVFAIALGGLVSPEVATVATSGWRAVLGDPELLEAGA